MEPNTTTSILFTFQDYKEVNYFTEIELNSKFVILLSREINEKNLIINEYPIENDKEDITVTFFNKESRVSHCFILTLYKNIKNSCLCFINQTYKNSIHCYYSVYSSEQDKIQKYNEENKNIIFTHGNVEIPIKIEYNLPSICYFTLLNIDISKFSISKPSIPFTIEKQYEIVKKDPISLMDKKETREIEIRNFKFCIKILLDKPKQIVTIHNNDYKETYAKIILKEYNEDYKEKILEYYHKLESFIRKLLIELQFNETENTFTEVFENNIDNIINQYKMIKDTFPTLREYLNLPLRIHTLTQNDLEIFRIHYLISVISQINAQFKKFDKTHLFEKKLLCFESKSLYQRSMEILDKIMKENLSIQEKIEKMEVNIVTLTEIFCNSKSIPLYKPPELVDLTELEHKKHKNIYIQAIQFLRNLIDNLTEDSALTFCFMQLNSIISRDLNIKNEDNDNKFEVGYIPLPQLKKKLHKLIPSKIYRIYANTDYNAIFSPLTEKVTINELHTFNEIQLNTIQTIFDLDYEDSEKRLVFPLICVLMHEFFGHALVRNDEENYGKISPIEFIKNGNLYYHMQ